MDIQGVIPVPIEDSWFVIKSFFKRRRNKEIENKIKKIDEDNGWPEISILMAWGVPSNYRPEKINREVIRCLRSVFSDGYPYTKIKVVIIVNGKNPPECVFREEDKEEDTVGKYARELDSRIPNEWRENLEVITVHSNVGNKAIPLNAGYSHAIEKFPNSEYILTIDPDGEIQGRAEIKSNNGEEKEFSGSLKRLMAHFLTDDKKDIGAVGGVITTRKEKIDNEDEKYRCYNRYTKWEFLVSEYSTRWLRSVYSPYLYHISGGISAFRKEVLDGVANKRQKIKAVVNKKYEEIEQVFNKDSVTEDYEITQHILDMGKKVEHDPYATYYGGAENNHKSQWKRFRRWYGGATQMDKYRENFFCNSSFWSGLSRGWRSISTRKYTYWWIFTFLLLPVVAIAAIAGHFYDIDSFTDFLTKLFYDTGRPLWRNILDYTFIGGIYSFKVLIKDLIYYGFSLKAFYNFSTFWLSFPKIYIAEVTLGWFELLFTTIFGFKSLNKKFGVFDKVWGYLGWCFWLPFEIVFWNRIYWFFFSIYGRVTKGKLPW